MENGQGTTVDVTKAQYDAYQATGGSLPFEAWYNAANVGGMFAGNGQPTTAPRKARKARKRSKARPVEHIAATAPSKARSKARGKHNPALADMAALSEKHAKLSREYFPKVKHAVRAFEGSAVKRDAARLVAQYFGTGTVDGMKQPLWTATYASQREAVALVWNVPTDEAHKADLDAAVQKMVRLRAEGYKLLGVEPPVKGSGRPPEPIVKRAMDSTRKFLNDMTGAERAQYLSEVSKLIRDMASGKVAVTPSKASKAGKKAA